MSNTKEDFIPTARFYFIERNVGTRTLNILHQVWQRPDGTEFLREVGKLSHPEAKERYDFNRSGNAGVPRAGSHRPSTVRGVAIA